MKTQCKATAKSTGVRCARSPIAGGAVCRVHGGAAPHVKKAARDRILAAAGDAVSTLLLLMDDPATPPAVRVTVARDLLDRAGEGAKQHVEVTTHDGDLADLDAALDRLTAHPRSPSSMETHRPT